MKNKNADYKLNINGEDSVIIEKENENDTVELLREYMKLFVEKQLNKVDQKSREEDEV